VIPMELLNLIFLIVGLIVMVIGLLAFFIPGFARLINAPGGPRTKAIIALIIGLFFVLLSILIEMPLTE